MRSRQRELLTRITPEYALRVGEAALERLTASPPWLAASTLVAFASIPGEVDTSPLLAAARAAGKRLCLPRLTDERSLEFARVAESSTLRAGRYGVPEPGPDCEALPVVADMLILVPGLAFDRRGGRLGRGAGYYDRALSGTLRGARGPVLVGLAFELQMVDRVPMTSTDLRLHACLTEAGLYQVDDTREPSRAAGAGGAEMAKSGHGSANGENEGR